MVQYILKQYLINYVSYFSNFYLLFRYFAESHVFLNIAFIHVILIININKINLSKKTYI